MILCGKGKSLLPFLLTRASGIPKALLPIANRPMIDYVLEWCDRGFFPKVTVICDAQSLKEISDAVDAYTSRRGESGAITNTVSVNSEHGLGAVVYALYNNDIIKANESFVLLPCDFITNLPPQVLIDAYRNKDPRDIGLCVYYRNQLDIEDKKHLIFKRHYTVYTDHSDGLQQLLDSYSVEDTEFHKALSLRTQMSWKYPNATVSTKTLGAGIFMGLPQALQVLKLDPVKYTDSYFSHRSIHKIVRDLARREWKHSNVTDRIGFLLVPEQALFFRCNSTPVLMEAQRHFMRAQARLKADRTHDKADKLHAIIGIDSCVGENTTLGEKTNVKRSVVGSDCKIGNRVKLTGTLVMHGCTISDDVQLENCIIGHGVTIHSKCKLVNCSVEPTHEVARGTTAKGEELLKLSLEGIVESGNHGALSLEEELSLDSSGTASDFDNEYHDEFTENDDGLFAY